MCAFLVHIYICKYFFSRLFQELECKVGKFWQATSFTYTYTKPFRWEQKMVLRLIFVFL